MTTTRINGAQREDTITHLKQVLSNIPRFVEMPIKTRSPIVTLWNSKFPRELIESLETIRALGYGTVSTVYATQFLVEHRGKKLVANVDIGELEMDTVEQPTKLSTVLVKRGDLCVKVKTWNENFEYAMPLSLDYMTHHLGAEDAMAFLDWIYETAELGGEIRNAVDVINDVFEMAKTAGQIKRMVPDLLQYLPTDTRLAYEEQKRASSLPFEWAPYPKENVERMILTVSKGHLLAGMAKPKQAVRSVDDMSSISWGMHVIG